MHFIVGRRYENCQGAIGSDFILDTSGDNPTIQQIDWVENS